jgi:hypothetical protein
VRTSQVEVRGEIKTVREVIDPRHEFLSERGVMDRTYAEFENAGDEVDKVIIAKDMFMELVEVEPEEKPKRGRKKKEETNVEDNEQ